MHPQLWMGLTLLDFHHNTKSKPVMGHFRTIQTRIKSIMKFRIFLATILLTVSIISFEQNIKRIDGSSITADSLNAKIEYLIKVANVSGVAIAVFNDNMPVFNKTYGLANVKKKYPH